MTELKNKVEIIAGGNLEQQANRWAKSMTNFARNGQRQLSLLARSGNLASLGLSKLGNRYTALITGAGAVGAVKSVASMETRLTRLGIAAGKSDKEIKTLYDNIYSTAQKRNINIDPSELISAVEEIMEKTGDLGLAMSNIENMGLAISATGAAGADIGALVSNLGQKFDVKSSDNMLKTLDLLTKQGKAGAFILKDFATQGERLTAAYSLTNRVGVAAVNEMGALAQKVRTVTGSSEQATTSIEGLVRQLLDPSIQKKLKRLKIQLYDPNEAGKMRSVLDIMKETVAKTKGDAVKINSIFTSAEAQKAFAALSPEYIKTGGFSSLDALSNVTKDGKTLMEDSARVARTFESSMTVLSTAFSKFANENLSEPIKELADALNNLSPEQLDAYLNNAKKIGITLGALVIGQKLGFGKLLGFGFNKLFGKKGGIAGALSASMSAPMPVYVVNMGDVGSSSMLPNAWGANNAKNASKIAKQGRLAKYGSALATKFPMLGKASRFAKLGKAGAFLSKGGSLLGKLGGRALYPAMVAYELATSNNKLEALGGIGGSVAGGAAGAAIGTALLPGIGTAIGGFLGSALGDYIARTAVDWGESKFADNQPQQQFQNALTIKFENAPDNMKVASKVLDKFTSIDVSLGHSEVFDD